MTGPILGLIAVAAICGTLAGWLFFVTLAPVARMLCAGRVQAVGLQLLRFVALGLFLWLCARGGTAVFLAAAAGVLAGRHLVMRKAAR